MNVGLMQFINTAPNGITSNSKQTSVINDGNNSNKFGDVFTKLLSLENNNQVSESEVNNSSESEVLQQLVSVDSLEDIFELFNIPFDGLFITLENDVKNVEELMNLDDLLSILGIEPTEFLATLSGLLGIEVPNNSNIWDIIEMVNANAEQIVTQLQAAFEGEHSITPKQSQQFLAFLKLAQVVGNQTDLVMDQPLQLVQLKEFINTAVKEILVTNSKNIVETSTGKIEVQNFQQVIERIVNNDSSEKPKDSSTKDNTQTTNGQTQQPVTTRTVTIQLPTEKSSQAEQLVNQIEKLLNQSQILKNQGIIKLQLKLYPEHLGSIRIELVQKDGVLSARLLATSAVAKEMLDSQLHQLKNALVQQNIQLDRIDIQQAIQDKDLRDQNLFNNFFNQQNQQNNEEQEQENPEEQEQESQSFKDYLLNVEV